jgi:hypothetical protein
LTSEKQHANSTKSKSINMENRRQQKKSDERTAAKKQPPIKQHAKKKLLVGNKNLSISEHAEQLYACLGDECEETFDFWGDARRHMLNCSSHSLADGTANLHQSRKKANDLLQEGGKAQVTTDPVPTEEKLAMDAHPEPEKQKDVLHIVVRKKWGPGAFANFGFGTFQELLVRKRTEN